MAWSRATASAAEINAAPNPRRRAAGTTPKSRDLIRQHQNQRRRPGGVHAAAKQAELDAMIREDRSSPMLLIVLVLIAIGFAVYWFVR
jgi:hypothetical protein